MRRWSFHTVALASGGADEELAAKKELLARLRADTALSSWQRSCSFRVVGRAQLEELVRATHAEETEARRREERKALQEAAGAGEGDTAGDAEEDKEDDDAKAVVVSPALLALAFQRLVARDKREFLAYPQSDPSEAEGASAQAQYSATEKEAQGSEEGEQDPAQPPARVYLLVDYPTSLAEVTALLRLGEVGSASQVDDGPENLPLLPLIDGVVLLADPSAARGRNRSSSTNVPRNRGGSVVKAEGGTSRMSVMETTAFQTSNAVVKVFYEAAQVGGIEWSDFTFTNIGCGATTAGTKSTEELEKEIISTVEEIAAQKFAFKNWVASTRFCAIPTSPGADGALYEQYESVLDGVFPGSVAVSTVLFAVAEAVATLASPPMKLPTPSCSRNQDASSNLEEFVEYGDIVGCRIASAQLFREALQADGDPCFVARGHRIDDIERAMWRRSDFPGVGNEGRKIMPRTPQLSEPERSVRNTELATFYESPRFSSWMVHLTRQLLQVEDLLGNSWRGRLQSRVFMEYLPRTILPQRIASVLQQNTADIYSSYYPATDSLLMACLPSTAPGRLRSTSWVARDHVRHRPAFKDWKQKLLISNEYLTPRSEAAAAACVPLSAGQLEFVATQSWSMYPADHSVVRTCQTPRGSLWLTVYLHGETFGLRSGAEHFSASGDNRGESTLGPSLLLDRKIHFIASFQDESTLHISEGKRRLPKKPDKFPTVAATNSFPNGLIVSACSDGSIIQRYSHSAQNIKNKGAYNASSGVNNAGVTTALQHEEEREAYRVIYGRGSVLRVLQCGRKEVLLANGITRVVQDCKTHRHDSRRRACNDAELPPPLATTLTVDPETNALVERRPNGVIIVTLTSGARVTYHADGTGMYLNAGNTHVLVKKRGFADVCIDVDVNITAQHHSAGERVAVTKGGLRVRSVVDVYDGTRVEISYNTKVTAQVNGRVTTRKPSGQIVVAKDSGRVEYISPGSMKNPAGPDSKDDDDRDVTSHNGVYYFDCRQGHFQLCDNEQNQFRVEFNGTDKEEGPSVAVDLAGVVSDAEVARYEVDAIPAKAVINEPIPPHVFVLNGDGSGVEIPRPQDIAGYIEGVATENQVGKTGGAQLSTTRSHVFLRHLRDSRPPTPIFNDAKVHAEMLGLQQPVATAAKYLPRFFAEAKITTPSQQFTTVRRIQQIEPLSADELLEMHAGWTKWEQWQEEREANKECYKVVDPRQPEVIAQEVAMQKKVLAAYKATRARKKLARQKAREMKAKNGQELSPGLRMETVQEGEETLGDEGEGESDDEFGQFGSDMSDDDVGETAEVDDPMELLWSAFSQADTEGRGLLSIAQSTCAVCCCVKAELITLCFCMLVAARLGVVNVLGIGVTANELTEALVRFKIPYPFNVSFDVFADLVAFFRSGDESNQDSEEPSSDQGSHIPSLKGMAPAQREGHGTPRGSAAEAIRARHLDGGSMSC